MSARAGRGLLSVRMEGWVLNVLFSIASFYPSQQGGPCNSVYALAKGLVRAGHEVRVVTTSFDISPDSGIAFDRWNDIDGIEIYYIGLPETKRRAVIYLYLTSISPLVNKVFKLKPCDVVHSTMLFTMLPHMGAAYAKDRQIPLVWSPRGSMLPYTLNRGTLKKKMFLSVPWIKKGLTGCHFHATSDEEESFIKEFMDRYTGESMHDRIHNIPNLAGDEIFTPGNDESPYPFRYILHLGRVHPKKNIENLIEAFALAKMAPDTRLVIAGWTGEDASYTRMLKYRVQKLQLGQRVVFTEKRVEGIDKATLYKHAEVFVLPSLSENFGMVVVESLAQGTPVIASNTTPWQVLEEKGAGYWVGNDVHSLAGTISRYYELTSNERDLMRKNAVNLSQDFRSERMVDRYVSMYEAVVK